MQSIMKDMISEKFNGKNSNAETWLQIFVRECDRLEIEENQRVEALRLFLDGIATKWFLAN